MSGLADDGEPREAPDPLRSIRAMIDAAPDAAAREVAVRLQARLNKPATAAARRVAELGLLASCLDERPQDPDLLPSFPQDLYEKRRGFSPNAPSAEVLVRRYGAWNRACYAAYGLRIDGSKDAPGHPWPSPKLGEPRPPTADRVACIQAINDCAQAIGRRPTSSSYSTWRGNRLARVRKSGEKLQIPKSARILAVLAPDRSPRDGWKIALSNALG